MHQPLQPIIQHLFQVSSLEDVSRERLESFVEDYPSFGVGHYLLIRKLKTEDPDRFQQEAQRACLYFSNPLWLQWLLENVEDNGGKVPVAQASWQGSDDLAETLTTGETQEITTVEIEAMRAGEGEAIEGQPVAETGLSSEPTAAEQLLRSIEEARELRESLQKINEDFIPDIAVSGEELPEDEPAPAAEAAAVGHEEPIHDEEAPFVLDEQEPAVSESPVTEPVAPESHIAQPEPTPPAPEPTPPPPAEPAKAEPPKPEPALVFEPYHTIDYFASQGIKLTLDENPADPLGRQLKSFTEWLKSMRRLPQKEREVVPDRVAEEAVQSFAAHSIESKDVVTETMAEVLAKQGMRERARVVYEKLSLLNPDKSAYFTAKIEQLNIP
jgi:hypothetical protein